MCSAEAGNVRGYSVFDYKRFTSYFVLVSRAAHLLRMKELAAVVECSADKDDIFLEIEAESFPQPIEELSRDLDDQLMMSNEPGCGTQPSEEIQCFVG
jgi:hypothetical protein